MPSFWNRGRKSSPSDAPEGSPATPEPVSERGGPATAGAPADDLGADSAAQAARANLPPLPRPANDSLAAIGEHNETLRSQIELIERSFDGVDLLRQAFRALVPPVSEVLADFEAAKRALSETLTKLAMLESAHETLGREHRSARSDCDRALGDLQAAQAEAQHHRQAAAQTNAALSDLQMRHSQASARVEWLERELDGKGREIAALNEGVKLLRDAEAERERLLGETRRERDDLRDRVGLLTDENRQLSASGAESTTRLSGVENLARALEAQLVEARRAAQESGQAIAQEREERARQLALSQGAADQLRTEMATLKAKSEALVARARTAETILEGARKELQEKIDESRAADRRATELAVELKGLEARLASRDRELADARAEAKGLESQRQSLAEKHAAATAAHSTVEGDLRGIEQRAQTLEGQLEDLRRTSAARQRELEQRLSAVTQELDRERTERALATGALEAARRDRQETQREYFKLRSVFVEDEAQVPAAEATDTAAHPSADAAKKLPRAATLAPVRDAGAAVPPRHAASGGA